LLFDLSAVQFIGNKNNAIRVLVIANAKRANQEIRLAKRL
jgi:hypothetical protein